MVTKWVFIGGNKTPPSLQELIAQKPYRSRVKCRKKYCDILVIFRERIEDLKDEKNEEIRLLLRKIDNLEPISPYGLCEVDRSLITSMISTSVTYLIILVQFKQSA